MRQSDKDQEEVWSRLDVYRLILDSVREGIWVTDENEVVRRWKPALDRALQSGRPVNTGEYRVTCSDGSARICELHAGFIADDLIVTFNDVTAAHQAEERRRTLEASLAQSDRLASMGLLAAGVAHEINNPLTFVLHNLESVVEDLPKLAEPLRRSEAPLALRIAETVATPALVDEEQRVDGSLFDDVIVRLREALVGVERIKGIVRSLGTFARVESSEAAPVNVERSIEHAIAMAQNEIKFRARLVRNFGAVPPVLGSEGKLAQVFLNLLINAAQAIDEGNDERHQITLKTWLDGDRVCVEVSDTGHGIRPEHKEKVFDPFFTTKEVGVGSGLGLSICKSIIDGLGGDISFESEVGKGTRFLVRLPRGPSAHEAERQVAPAPMAVTQKIRGRVLVVDDEEPIRKVVVRLLRAEHDVVTAASGAEALAVLERDRNFDVTFCDLMMPRQSGMELHAWLAQRDARLAEQVVFITGGVFIPGAEAYLAQVRNRRVEKPFNVTAFKQLTHELVLAARSSRGA